MAIRSPRKRRIASSLKPTSSRPSNRIEPPIRAPSGASPISASAVIVFPEPDSPTTPRTLAFAEAEARAVDDPDGAALPRQVDDEVSYLEQHL